MASTTHSTMLRSNKSHPYIVYFTLFHQEVLYVRSLFGISFADKK